MIRKTFKLLHFSQFVKECKGKKVILQTKDKTNNDANGKANKADEMEKIKNENKNKNNDSIGYL